MNPLLAGVAAASAGAAVGAIRYLAKTRGPFEVTRYAWSRGLALACDKNGGVDFIKGQRGGRRAIRFDPRTYQGVRAGDLVWVRLIALPQFVEDVLPHIHEPFALVTGDEDWAIPSGFDGAAELLANQHLVHWFSQNFDGTDASGRISPIPIGLDFHTISNGRKWGHWPATPAEQEAALDELVEQMPATTERSLRVHADFHFNVHKKQVWGERRDDVAAQLRSNPLIVFQQHRVRRLDLWRQKTRFAFVVSPHGNGLDCHRTWESLVLGNIVIVKRSSLDPLYEGLPVVIVDDWDAITRANLERWLAQHGDAWQRGDVRQRLTNDYWIQHMRRVMALGS